MLLQFVVQDANAHQTIPFLNYWSDLLGCQGGHWHDEIMFKRLSVDGGGAGQAAADALYHSSVIEKGSLLGPIVQSMCPYGMSVHGSMMISISRLGLRVQAFG